MKKTVLSIALLLYVTGAFAQGAIYGIYNNWYNYVAGTYSYSIPCDSSNDKIRLHHFFSGRYMDIIKDGKTIRLCKDSIFGYTDCNHNTYRFYKSYDKEYCIEENKDIVIYTACISIPTSQGRPKLVQAYFFSVTLSSPVRSLTILNLKKAFPGNLKFHDMLDITFAYGAPVSAYDTVHKMYKVNFLLNESLNK